MASTQASSNRHLGRGCSRQSRCRLRVVYLCYNLANKLAKSGGETGIVKSLEKDFHPSFAEKGG